MSDFVPFNALELRMDSPHRTGTALSDEGRQSSFIRRVVVIASAVLLSLLALAIPALASPPPPPAGSTMVTATLNSSNGVTVGWRDDSSSEPNNRPSPPPTDARVIGVPGGLQITWQDNSRNETAWIINDGITNQSFTVTGESVGTRSFAWKGMQANEYKCLRVRPYNQWGAGDYAPGPPANYACGNASGGGAAKSPLPPTNVQSFSCQGTLGARLQWAEQSDDWDSFRIYKNGVLVKDVTPDRSSGPVYGEDVPLPVENALVGVKAVKSGVESVIAYANNGQRFSC